MIVKRSDNSEFCYSFSAFIFSSAKQRVLNLSIHGTLFSKFKLQQKKGFLGPFLYFPLYFVAPLVESSFAYICICCILIKNIELLSHVSFLPSLDLDIQVGIRD